MQCLEANIPITIVEGGTFDKSFQWKTGDPLAVVDLTDYTARMQVRAKLRDTITLLDIETATEVWAADGNSGIYITEGVNSMWQIYIKDDDTLGMCASHKDIAGVYDLFLYNPAGEAVLKQYGVATIVAVVTRDE